MNTFGVIAIILFVILLVVVIIALIVWIKRTKDETVEFSNFYDNVKESAFNQIPYSMYNFSIRLSGDEKHEGVRLGRMVGYTRLRHENKLTSKKNDKKEVSVKFANVIYYSTTGKLTDIFPFSVFRQTENIVFFDNQLMTALQGDVRVRGVNTEKVGKFNWVIDLTTDKNELVKVVQEGAIMTLSLDIIEQVSTLVRRGINANASHEIVKDLKDDVLPVGSRGN